MANRYMKQFLFSFNPMLTFIEGNVVFNGAGAGPGPVAPSMGAAAAFAILAGSTVTNTGPSIVTGDLGLSPGTSVTGFPPGSVVGTQHITDTDAANAQLALTAAMIDLAGRAVTANLTGLDLGGMTLAPGVYKFNTSAQLTGILTLDAQGDPNAVFIFQIGSTLTTASASSVVMINSGQPRNVFFQVGTSATIGTTSAMKGNILAAASITLTTGASLLGSAMASSGAVTLDTNVVTNQLSLVPPAAIAIGTIKGSGIKNISRVSLGVYDIFLDDPWMRYLSGTWGFVAAPASSSGIMVVEVEGDPNLTINLPGIPRIRIHMLDKTNALADPAANTVFGFTMMVRNSSVKGKGE